MISKERSMRRLISTRVIQVSVLTFDMFIVLYTVSNIDFADQQRFLQEGFYEKYKSIKPQELVDVFNGMRL